LKTSKIESNPGGSIFTVSVGVRYNNEVAISDDNISLAQRNSNNYSDFVLIIIVRNGIRNAK
jgi:hypothetical protein